MTKNENKEMVKFFYEAGALKNIPRSGWFLCGVRQPESVADHSFRTALIACFLAEEEKADSCKCIKMALFHDLHESRILDMHKVGARYFDSDKIGKKVVEEQSEGNNFLCEYNALMDELFEMKSKEAVIVKDADYLECALQAKEYLESGHKNAQDWLDRIKTRLKTEGAKQMFKIIIKTDSKEWWKGLKVLR